MRLICFFIYEDENSLKKKSFGIEVLPGDPDDYFMNHYKNALYFFNENTTNAIEKIQINKELEIAKRKMDYWKRHRFFNTSRVLNLCIEAKRQWKLNRVPFDL